MDTASSSSCLSCWSQAKGGEAGSSLWGQSSMLPTAATGAGRFCCLTSLASTPTYRVPGSRGVGQEVPRGKFHSCEIHGGLATLQQSMWPRGQVRSGMCPRRAPVRPGAWKERRMESTTCFPNTKLPRIWVGSAGRVRGCWGLPCQMCSDVHKAVYPVQP